MTDDRRTFIEAVSDFLSDGIGKQTLWNACFLVKDCQDKITGRDAEDFPADIGTILGGKPRLDLTYAAAAALLIDHLRNLR